MPATAPQTTRQPRTAAARPSIGRLALIAAAGMGALFLIVPLVVLVARGAATRGWEGLPQTGVAEAVGLSLMTTTLSTGFTLLLGTPLAYVLARWRFPGRGLINTLVTLPIVLPPAVAGLALLLTFGRRGLLGPSLTLLGLNIAFTPAAVVMAQTFVAAPFFIRAAVVGFRSISHEIEDAARVDGAGGLTLFRLVTLPLAGRVLAAGLILAWARALGEFGATIMFAGSLSGRTQTMPLLVYSVFERSIDAAIWTGVLLLGVAVIALLISQWLSHAEENA
jgi:molybdate transport system permease protein